MPDTNRYARKTYSPDGTNREFAFDIPYQKAEELEFKLNGVIQLYKTDWQLINPSIARFNAVPPAGDGTLVLTRNTNVASPAAAFTSPGTFTFTNLNRIVKQLLYGVQESHDRSIGAETILEVALRAANDASASAATASHILQGIEASATFVVENMEALRGLTVRPDVVTVQGFYEVGIGGGLFDWHPEDSSLVVLGMNESPISGPQGRYKRRIEGPAQPSLFGAKGDHQLVFTSGTMTAGGNTLVLSLPLPVGVAGGMCIFVDGAGPSGEQLITRIVTVNAARDQLTLSANAVRAITNKSLVLRYGSDDYAPLQAMMDWAYAHSHSVYVPPGPSGVWLTTDTLKWRQPYVTATNVREAQMTTLRVDDGATIKWASAAGTGKAVIQFGDVSTYDQLLRKGIVAGGTYDCSMVADIGVDLPFAIESSIREVEVLDVKLRGFKVGELGSPSTSGGVRIDNCRIARSTLTRQLTVTGITNAAEAVVSVADYNWDDGRVITIYAADGMPEVNGRFFKIGRLTQNTFKLVGVDSTAWGTFTGSAIAMACMPSMRVSWAITGLTKANPAVVTLSQAPAEPNGARAEIHAIEGMFQLEGANVYLKAVSGQPTKYELYVDAGLTTGVDSSDFDTYTGGGFLTEYVNPNAMETGIYYENSPDNKTSNNIFRGLRIGISGMAINQAGYGGTHADNHFHNYDPDGSMYAHYWQGGKNRIIAPYIDGPTKYGFVWEGDRNDIYALQHFHNSGGIWIARDNFPIVNKTQSGGAAVRTWGGCIEGGALNRIFADHVGLGNYYWMGIERGNVSHYPDSELTPRSDPRFYGNLRGPQFRPYGDPSTSWAMDSTDFTITIGNGETFDLQTGSGVFALTEQVSGYTYQCIAGKDDIRVDGNNSFSETILVNTLTPTVGQIGIAVTGNRIRINNNRGSHIAVCIAGLRTREII